MCEAEPSDSTVMSPTTNTVSNSTTLEQLSTANKQQQQMIEVRQAMYNGNSDSPSGSESSSSSSGSGSDRDISPVLQDYPEQSREAARSLQVQGE